MAALEVVKDLDMVEVLEVEVVLEMESVCNSFWRCKWWH